MKLPARLKKPGYKIVGALLLVTALATAPRWGSALLHNLSFFRVRTIDIRGVHYLRPTEIISRLRIDTLRSIIDDVSPLEERLSSHPQIASVEIQRRPPGRLVVLVTENRPVALVPQKGGVRPVDTAGRMLPIDPSRTDLDLPVLNRPDSAVLLTLGTIRREDPDLFAQISYVEWSSSSGMLLTMKSGPPVRAMPGVAPGRFRDIFPVAADLERRDERAAEIDLRFRDQVVVRLP